MRTTSRLFLPSVRDILFSRLCAAVHRFDCEKNATTKDREIRDILSKKELTIEDIISVRDDMDSEHPLRDLLNEEIQRRCKIEPILRKNENSGWN